MFLDKFTYLKERIIEATDRTKINYLLGKLNPKVVKALFKVVIEDTEYEISCILDYLKYIVLAHSFLIFVFC